MYMKNIYYYQTSIGELGIAEDGVSITEIFISNNEKQEPCDTIEIKETPLLKKAAEQLSEYFAGKRKEFELPLNPNGTEFQKKVWDMLKTIPYGERWSYKQVAEAIGNPKACRAVGMANNKNPIMIVVPCHRVVGSNGKLVGYAGGLDIKEKLLYLEEEK